MHFSEACCRVAQAVPRARRASARAASSAATSSSRGGSMRAWRRCVQRAGALEWGCTGGLREDCAVLCRRAACPCSCTLQIQTCVFVTLPAPLLHTIGQRPTPLAQALLPAPARLACVCGMRDACGAPGRAAAGGRKGLWAVYGGGAAGGPLHHRVHRRGARARQPCSVDCWGWGGGGHHRGCAKLRRWAQAAAG